MWVLEVPLPIAHRRKIAERANAFKLPTLFGPDQADAGGVIAYGTGALAAVRKCAGALDRILKGARPADLPVERVLDYQLVVNRKAAASIGMELPDEVLRQATRLID